MKVRSFGKKSLFVLLLSCAFSANLIAEGDLSERDNGDLVLDGQVISTEELPEIPDEELTFSEATVDLSKEEIIPLKNVVGKTFRLKDDSDQATITYSFKKNNTYTMVTRFSIMKITIRGVYEVTDDTITFTPTEVPEARVFGIKIPMDEDQTEEDTESFSTPEECYCILTKRGILIEDSFFKKI